MREFGSLVEEFEVEESKVKWSKSKRRKEGVTQRVVKSIKKGSG